MTSPLLFSSREMTQRLARVRSRMVELELDALIATNPANVRYLTGFKGEPRTLLITPDQFHLITDLRTLPWAKHQTSPLDSLLEISTSKTPAHDIAQRLTTLPLKIGIDLSTTHQSLESWRQTLAQHDIKPAPVVEHTRRIKSPAEIALLEKSQVLNETILAAVLPKIRPHQTERGVQGLILAEMARHEAIDGFSFNPIVASGPNCWEIHHLPDHTVIGENPMLLIDLGIIHHGYASDMTRTICLGKATAEMRDIHQLVSSALDTAISATTAGKTNHEIDRIARDIITDAGFGETFTHGLGHHIGLETHDPAPPLAPKAPKAILESGMALTIEPGIYLENKFGVRTEDVIIVTEAHAKNITRPSHDLLELPI